MVTEPDETKNFFTLPSVSMTEITPKIDFDIYQQKSEI